MSEFKINNQVVEQLVKTPISNRISDEIIKCSKQYQEGAITAVEFIAKCNQLTEENMEEIINEYAKEKDYWEKVKVN